MRYSIEERYYKERQTELWKDFVGLNHSEKQSVKTIVRETMRGTLIENRWLNIRKKSTASIKDLIKFVKKKF